MNVFDPLKNVAYAPAAIVQTHYKGKGCELLTMKTFKAINDETLATIFVKAQQNSIKLACQKTFKENLTQSILLKLKMATKMNNMADLYEDLLNKGLEFLPFWNTIRIYGNIDHYGRYRHHHHHYDKDCIYDHYDDLGECRCEITSAIKNWLKPNSMDIFIDNFYVKFIASFKDPLEECY
ncbi:hypothetical protein F5888DRAFT_1633932 [Russula emetica]|nr:hypothetical protein F5888DRAFT_1633932 [Russula emetica]